MAVVLRGTPKARWFLFGNSTGSRPAIDLKNENWSGGDLTSRCDWFHGRGRNEAPIQSKQAVVASSPPPHHSASMSLALQDASTCFSSFGFKKVGRPDGRPLNFQGCGWGRGRWKSLERTARAQESSFSEPCKTGRDLQGISTVHLELDGEPLRCPSATSVSARGSWCCAEKTALAPWQPAMLQARTAW